VFDNELIIQKYMRTDMRKKFNCILLILTVLSISFFLQAKGKSGLKLTKFKNPTAFIKVFSDGKECFASGFLAYKTRNTAYIITNASLFLQKDKKISTIKIIFNSGTSKENSYYANIAAFSEDSDVAILTINPAGTPKPLSLNQKTKLKESEKVFVLGFSPMPNGKSKPSVNISKGTISSLRKNKKGKILTLKINVKLDAENTGGPVFTYDGVFIGMTSAIGRKMQLGLLIPKNKIMNTFSGSVKDFSRKVTNVSGNNLTVEVNAYLLDPLERITAANLLLAYRNKNMTLGSNEKNGTFRKIRKASIVKKLDIDLNHKTASATFTIPLKKESDYYNAQIQFIRKGIKRYSQPAVWSFSKSLLEKNEKNEKNEKKTNDKNVLEKSQDISEPPFKLEDASVFPLKFKGEFALCPIWSKHGKYFYILSSKGILHEILVPELIEHRQLDLGFRCSELAMSKSGIIILSAIKKQLIIVDEKTLRIKDKLDIGSCSSLASVPNSNIAFVEAGNSFSMIDLNKKSIVARYDSQKMASKVGGDVSFFQFNKPAMTTDGNFLFCLNDSRIYKFQIDETELLYEGTSPKIGIAPRIEISDDNMFITLSGACRPLSGLKKFPYQSYIFSTKNLTMPITVLAEEKKITSLSFDEKNKYIYTMSGNPILSTNCLLSRYSGTGEKLKSYSFETYKSFDDMISPHPDGKGLMLLQGKCFYWVEFDKGTRATLMPDGQPGPGSKKLPLWQEPNGFYDDFLKNAPAIASSGLIKKLQDFPYASIPAYGGAYLIMQFNFSSRLGIFNIATGTFDKYIPLKDSESLYAAGGDLLIIYSNKLKIFERWNLRTLEKIDSKKVKLPFNVVSMSMGMNCSQYAYIAGMKNNKSLLKQYFMNTKTFQCFSVNPKSVSLSLSDNVYFRINPSFSSVMIGEELCVGNIQGRVIDYKNITTPYRYSGPSPNWNTQVIYSTTGCIYDFSGKQLHHFTSNLFTIYGSDLFLEVDYDTINVRSPENYEIMKSIKIPFPLKIDKNVSKTRMKGDCYLFASAPLQRIVVFNKKIKEICLLNCSFDSIKIKKRANLCVPGKKWRKKLDIPIDSKVVIQDAPNELKYDKKTTSLIWDIPIDMKSGNVSVLISIIKPNQDEEYKNINIKIEKPE